MLRYVTQCLQMCKFLIHSVWSALALVCKHETLMCETHECMNCKTVGTSLADKKRFGPPINSTFTGNGCKVTQPDMYE